MNTMKYIKMMACVIFLLSSYTKAEASDFNIIYDRMYQAYLGNPSKTLVESILNNMSDKGSFYDIDYTVKDGSPRKHLIYLTELASAYSNPANSYCRNSTVLDAYLKGLRFWINTNNQPKNWWFRYIAYPKELSKGVILMDKNIKADKELFNMVIKYLRWSYEHSEGTGRMGGANGADIIIGSIAASVLTKNSDEMLAFKNDMAKLVSIQDTEGIQIDYMFAQHCGHGRQLYLGNYGKEYMNSVLYYFEFCKGTSFNSPALSTLIDFQINGVQWIYFNKRYDPCITGRFLNSDANHKMFKELAMRLYDVAPSDRKAELKTAYKRIASENSLTGNRMYWRFDYMIHRRTNYMISTRMTSTRTVGNEAGNGAGEGYYYSSNGTNYITTSGEEFTNDFFKRFNNRQFPGTTAEQDSAKLPIAFWGENGGNEKSFAGGVSDSTYGACGMELQRRGVSAHKGWFYFDDEFVCLGADIHEQNGQANVYTTLNQCNLDKNVLYSVNGNEKTLKNEVVVCNPDWILHGGIAYFNLQPDAMFIITANNGIFAANINHGTNPKNQSYAYIVKPGTSTGTEANSYLKTSAIHVIANNDSIQAVKHSKLGITEIIFYKAGLLKLDGQNTISVDAPCALIWNEHKKNITIANPNCESNNPAKIHVNLHWKGTVTRLEFQMPTDVYAGSSIVRQVR